MTDMLDSYTFVVVGGGIAGVSCVESLLTWLPGEPVLLLSTGSWVKRVTNSVQLTKTLIQFDVEEQSSEELMSQHPNLHIAVDEVIAVDCVAHVVTTASGRSVGYQKLCLCMGGRPNIIGESNPHVIGIRDTDSVAYLQEKLAQSRKVVIAGNGGIASELIYEVQGVEKVWVVKDEHIGSVFLGPEEAEFFSDCLTKTNESAPVVCRERRIHNASGAALGPHWLEKRELKGNSEANSLNIIYGSSFLDVKYNESEAEFPVRAILNTGVEISADLVISATGVVPSSGLKITPVKLKLAGDGGIIVDDCLRTSATDVFAAGDVATAGWTHSQHWFQMRLWTQASLMGRHAGRVMACSLQGENVPLDFCFEIFSHVTRFFGMKVILLGLFNAQKIGTDHYRLMRITRGREYVKLVMQNGKVQGAVLIGDTELEEMCENLILDQLDVTSLEDDLLDPNIDIDDYFD